ncbi:MAG TPA: HAD-IA family hydrolase [Rhizomicrobium sp.]|jgi:putative hydrolase of the HAD superfamily
MRAIDVVLFDADGVFQRPPADFLQRLAHTALGNPELDGMPLLSDIFDAEHAALAGQADFAVTLVPVLQKWNAVCDVQAMLEHWHAIDTDHSVLALVSELRRSGVVCAVASNQQSYRAAHMSATLGYAKAFDHEFYSCHLGHAKPAEDYFHAIVRIGGFDPAHTLFLDDREANVKAARSAGLNAEHFVLGEIGSGAEALRALLQPYGVFSQP